MGKYDRGNTCTCMRKKKKKKKKKKKYHKCHEMKNKAHVRQGGSKTKPTTLNRVTFTLAHSADVFLLSQKTGFDI